MAGLKFSYLRVYNKHKADKDLCSIHINDSCENILERLTFYDKDSIPVKKYLDDTKKKKYLQSLRDDYQFFRNSYRRADLKIDINNMNLEDIVNMIIRELPNTVQITGSNLAAEI